MTRVKRGTFAHAKHKKIIKQAKGYYGSRSRSYRSAFQAVTKSGQYSYRDRRKRKVVMRQLWISRINAESRRHGLNYSKFIQKLKQSSIIINRKILSELIMFDKKAFSHIISSLK
ncbi:50S ribosomal protein L20 [Candidatus Riesia pediculischaeffi]|uniref:Large ribosomal subunit protein bL20 n=1 Tax=Candidatus Riesia pediculischaeffi PTSU TaxID=1401651 RepID=A0A0C1VJG4_9ENTR|nr:50S ribosomal protein L20 [Candidatus Riesia pediculischaeffi]KIE63990.1 LSU ribosomal protein L20p [Candidatus Riesia pediculischaeffi PTSU]